MNVYLAGEHTVKNGKEIAKQPDKLFILESYFYCKTSKHFSLVLDHSKDLLLDSGAFTFMSKNESNLDWENYINEFASFINTHKINYFFELDIDSIVGLKKVEKLRKKLEAKVGKKSIPVWHKSRGLDYWKWMVKEYDYVSIGGIVTREIRQKEYPVFTHLLNIAKDNNCKVHGLGFTNLKGLQKYKFYSVDSTAWLYGNIGAYLYKFNGRSLDKIMKPDGMRMKSKQVAIHNFNEWVKFQKYAEKHL